MSLIRETEADVEVWYAAASRHGPGDWAANGMKDIIDQVVAPENRDWYYKTMAKLEKSRQQDHKSLNPNGEAPRMNGGSFTARSSHSRAPSVEEYLNKPLPPLPQPPYFEYMFADAGVKDKKPDATAESLLETNHANEIVSSQPEPLTDGRYATFTSDSSSSSIGLDSAELAQFACAQAGVDIFPIEPTRSSQDHFPANASEASDSLRYPEGEPMQFEFSQIQSSPRHKVILEPKSQKSKTCLRNEQPINAAPRRIITAPAVQPSSPDIIRKIKKRCARDSFLTKSTVNDSKDDYDVNLLCTKKVRVEEQRHSRDVQSMRASSVYSSIAASNSSYSVATNEDISQRKRPYAALTGYPGQFQSYEIDFLHCRTTGIPSPRIHFTCGDPLHPNNQFTHTNFLTDPTWPSKNYTKEDLERFPMRNAALSYADRLTVRAARILTRTESEENLRREVQRECAAARLEGVAVGQYRYYQGHMSMEEYKAARICICWDSCWCSKLCTIYGDVLCPCSEWTVLQNH
ncbi:hypothetical protein A1O3_04998 [Capronia epimyces CBS 606.96]|uniref:Uncharacterized protein n=1 Tax=Capronia epimyces CBS 606.96 TaxID=1182542 RepID=W9Y557_9EURO|nr:uncharacterized protein A1O3_04998 [Capronia epimyces CBS 606.96]EXJ84331.1 hypothetical protein A1O3_04998 [Capronia epimyces CBS 606.96]